jgi:hypothetical protein
MRRTGKISKPGKELEAALLKPKKQITIRIEAASIDYFKKQAEETGVSYQNLINLFLSDAAKRKKRPNVRWTASRATRRSRKIARPAGRPSTRKKKS